jgi:hypothetical protein
MNKLSDCITEIKEIRPLPNGEKYAAKVKYFYVESEEGRKRVDQGSPEFWGHTPDEAKEKAEKYIQDLVERNKI